MWTGEAEKSPPQKTGTTKRVGKDRVSSEKIEQNKLKRNRHRKWRSQDVNGRSGEKSSAKNGDNEKSRRVRVFKCLPYAQRENNRIKWNDPKRE
jgi:hypothetical protein